MLRLIKFLKPYILLIVLTIALLFIQANAELALPEYLSNIVDIGIQQFGVENAVPQAVRQSEMERLLIFMGEQEKALVLNNFFLLSPDSPSAEMFVSEYPILEVQSIFVLKDVDQVDVNLLNPVLSKALLTVSTIEQMVTEPDNTGVIGQITGIDPSIKGAGSE